MPSKVKTARYALSRNKRGILGIDGADTTLAATYWVGKYPALDKRLFKRLKTVVTPTAEISKHLSASP